MTAYAYATPNEKALSGALALLMHGLFVALLVFSIAWQKRESPAMVAELWSSLPPVPLPKAEPPPPPKVEPKPEPPRPVPKVEPKPKPVPKPDISLREKKEKALKAKELAEKKKKEEQARREALKLQQAKEAEERRLREQEEALKNIAAQKAAAQAKAIDEYTRQIHDKIKSRIVNAGCLSLKNPEVQLRVILLPDGNVLDDPRVTRSSGAPTCDNAVARAVLLAQPLPVPRPDTGLFPRFRDLSLNFRPND